VGFWHGWSIRARLTVLATVVMTFLCVVAAAFILWIGGGVAEGFRTDEVVGATLRVVHLIKRDRLPPVLPDMGVEAIQVINAQGKVVSASRGVHGQPRMAAFRPDEVSVRGDKILCQTPTFPDECVIVVAFRVFQPEGDWLIYAADEQVPWYIDTRLFTSIIAGSLLLIGVTGFGSYRITGKALAPVDAITDKLAEITTTDLGQRVPVPKFDDELKRLAETANQTLNRAEAAVEKQRQFASDASHDLRSPLTAMRAEIEGALLHPDKTDWPEVGGALLGSLDRLQALVSDLLQIARLDASAPGRPESIDLAELATRELDRRTRKVRVQRDLTDGVVVIGDRIRLTRLLTNLLDNAERHAVTQFRILVDRAGDMAVLEVEDDGAGIDPAKRDIVFERFTRLDASRSRDAGGTGLGLPIARQIAESHNGSLTIEDSPRGARFVLRIPLAH
jgi:signal transduction histidine kinase